MSVLRSAPVRKGVRPSPTRQKTQRNRSASKGSDPFSDRLSPLILIVAFSVLLGGACSPAGEVTDRIVLTGSSTIAPLMGEIAKRFEERHPGVRVDVQSGGSSRGIADVRRDLADIGMVSRDLKPDEQDLHSFTIARDGVGIIVHRQNPISALSDEQIVAIFTGRITNWQEVGGAAAEITVVTKAEGRSTLELFLTYFHLASSDIQADVVIGDNEQGVKTVAGNPHAIGYVSIGTAEYDAEQGVAIKLLPLGGVAATIENVRLGSFPLTRPLNLVTQSAPRAIVDTFLAFTRSPEVHDLIQEQYFVPLAE